MSDNTVTPPILLSELNEPSSTVSTEDTETSEAVPQEVGYIPRTWEDGLSSYTPLTAASLNNIELGIQNLITQVNALQDSVSQAPWQTLLANACYYFKSGGIVVVQLYNLTLTRGARRSVGTLPEGFRPTGAATWDGRAAVGVVYGGGASFAYAYVSPSGEVWCQYAEIDGDYTGQVVFPA